MREISASPAIPLVDTLAVWLGRETRHIGSRGQSISDGARDEVGGERKVDSDVDSEDGGELMLKRITDYNLGDFCEEDSKRQEYLEEIRHGGPAEAASLLTSSSDVLKGNAIERRRKNLKK